MPEKAILVAVDSTRVKDRWPIRDSMAELSNLACSAGANVVGKLIQKLPTPSRMQYLGKGKLDELLSLKEQMHYETVVIDDELTPQQQENLEDFLHVKVIDRVSLILDIFASRARTKEGKLQVELAQCEYNLPRLAGKWRHLGRLGAGIGTRGPGESQLETDKRIMRRKIASLKKQLDEVREEREMRRQRRKRSGVQVAALVGYTNSGKSTLLNTLSRSEVIAKNELFSTLDPTTRRVLLPDGRVILLSDTVGFIRKLPPDVIAAFRATLEELSDASILVQVIDITSQKAEYENETVEEVLKDLDLQDKPRIIAMNKIDMLLISGQSWDEKKAIEYISAKCGTPSPGMVLISAEKKWGLNELKDAIGKMLE